MDKVRPVLPYRPPPPDIFGALGHARRSTRPSAVSRWRPSCASTSRATRSRCVRLSALHPHSKPRAEPSPCSQIGNSFFRQAKGIPQGSVVSTYLCSLFYADMERKHLAFTQQPDSVRPCFPESSCRTLTLPRPSARRCSSASSTTSSLSRLCVRRPPLNGLLSSADPHPASAGQGQGRALRPADARRSVFSFPRLPTAQSS